MIKSAIVVCLGTIASLIVVGPAYGADDSSAAAPRILNIYNFLRNSDYRLVNSEDVLFEATLQQARMLKAAGLPITWAVQYDALINPRYQKLLKEEIGKGDEIGAWWELPQALVEKAGISWRGKHEWDSRADVGFSPGYTPSERKRLVDVYMGEFHRVFGSFPRSVGSWYIDEVTLAYMHEKYGIVASCDCKDQIGTDGYTLWGGYWSGGYYPSRVNAYMPAQTRTGQIDVPIFRMLGSDPIYQYGSSERITTLEPVYPWAGGSEGWVKWFLDCVVNEPCLAYGYAQAGQENSFGWEAMKSGYTNQVEMLGKLRSEGKIRVETLAETGEWFRRKFEVTPATAFVATSDWKNEGRKSVWYDSRFYRVNFLWEGDSFFIRDLHLFDERVVSPTHDEAMKTTALAYETLPVVDGAEWEGKRMRAGGWPVILGEDGTATAMVAGGNPQISQEHDDRLVISQGLSGGGKIEILCDEGRIRCKASDASGKPMNWGWEIRGDERIRGVTAGEVGFEMGGTKFSVLLPQGSAHSLQSTIRLTGDARGVIGLDLSRNSATR